MVLTNGGKMRIINIVVRTETMKCGCSSSGRAPPCQGGGSEFEPRHPLHVSSRENRLLFFFFRAVVSIDTKKLRFNIQCLCFAYQSYHGKA